MTAVPGFCGQTYLDRSINANAQDCINLYPFHSPTPQDPNRIILYPTPGYALIQNIPLAFATFFSQGMSQFTMIGSESRAVLTINNIVYMVVGNRFLSFAGGILTPLGTLNTYSGKVSIVTNTVDITMSDSGNGYVYNLTTTAFTTIVTSGGWPTQGVTNLTYQDGYYLAMPNGTRTVIQSAILDGTTWPALAFDTTISFPDNGVAVFSDQNQLYVMGPHITEVQFDAGTIPYAFQKVSGVLIQAGCVAKNSIVKVGSTVIWLADDLAGNAYIGALQGYSLSPISTAPINEAIARYSVISDAFGYTYREGDNQFYVITFPSANATWAYDLKTKQWHKRIYNNGMDLPLVCSFYNNILLPGDVDVPHSLQNHLVGDANGKIYIMSQDWAQVYQDESNVAGVDKPQYWPTPRQRVSPHLEQDGKLIFLHKFELMYQAGVGINTSTGTYKDASGNNLSVGNPKCTLEVSKDGGHSWINVGTRELGMIGQYKKRMIWRNLGRAWKWTFRITISEPVNVIILGADVDVALGK